MKLLIMGDLAVEAVPERLQRVADAAQDVEGLDLAAYVCLTLTDDEGIREVNRSQRKVDKVTDVLSFPSISFLPGATAASSIPSLTQEWDPEQGACFLGDILICLPQARRQAQNFGHSLERELAYLLAHGLFHLMGYDHLKEDDKTIMRSKEERALAQAGQSLVSDAVLLQQARAAMEHSYSPYSHFRVGACLLSQDGRSYTGCNVENASYGLTNCAERTAMFKAISEGAKGFTTLAIAADSQAPWPCGACRQVLSEFAPHLRILVTWGEGQVEESTLQALLPHSFSPSNGVQDFLGKEPHD
ncbi:MAG: cytidine deaminase [Christensenellales bacterium]